MRQVFTCGFALTFDVVGLCMSNVDGGRMPKLIFHGNAMFCRPTVVDFAWVFNGVFCSEDSMMEVFTPRCGRFRTSRGSA